MAAGTSLFLCIHKPRTRKIITFNKTQELSMIFFLDLSNLKGPFTCLFMSCYSAPQHLYNTQHDPYAFSFLKVMKSDNVSEKAKHI